MASHLVGHEAFKREDRRPVLEPEDLISDFSGLGLRETEHAANWQEHSGRMTREPTATAADCKFSRETQDWELERSHLDFERMLGVGSFGEVWKGKYRNVTDVAIKRMRIGLMSVEAFRDEAQIIKSCRHEHLVRLYGICSRAEHIYIVTELMTSGSLLEYLREGAGLTASVGVLTDMARQVASGMAFLEEKRISHRNLAARNVLVGENNVVKVADFGLARALAEGNSAYKPDNPDSPFPFKWTAPEAALFSCFTIKSDVWSYGILLHELMTRGDRPYPIMRSDEVLEQVQQGYRMGPARECPEPVYDVMLKCWDLDPNQRPTFRELLGFFEEQRSPQVQKLQRHTAENQIVMGDAFSRNSSPDEPKDARSLRDSSPDETMAARPSSDSSPDQPVAARSQGMKNTFSDTDAEEYRTGYPGKRDDPNAKDNLKFYTNKLKSKPKGDFIDNIHKNWKGKYRLLENHHGYIQWLFPIRRPGLNDQAQELQLHEAEAIKKDPQTRKRVLKSYELMLDFYGMRLKDRATGEIERAENWRERFAHLNGSSHNHMRITRILCSLGELGFAHFQYPFVEFLLKEVLVKKTLVKCVESCYNYWIDTVKNDTERRMLGEFFNEKAECVYAKKSHQYGCTI